MLEHLNAIHFLIVVGAITVHHFLCLFSLNANAVYCKMARNEAVEELPTKTDIKEEEEEQAKENVSKRLNLKVSELFEDSIRNEINSRKNSQAKRRKQSEHNNATKLEPYTDILNEINRDYEITEINIITICMREQKSATKRKRSDGDPEGEEVSGHPAKRVKLQSSHKRTKSEKTKSDEKSKDSDDKQEFAGGLEPEEILGASIITDRLVFRMKWKNRDKTDLVSAADANVICPQLVIQFYEQKLVFP